MKKIVHVEETKRDKDGRPYKVLVAYEIVKGQRRKLETPNQPHGQTTKEKYK